MPQRKSLNARSVVLSVVLGTEPPELPVSWLVKAAQLFDISEGTTRTALTRMTQRGELIRTDEGWYRLGAAQALRQRRQRESRTAETTEWSGRWQMAVVTAEDRTSRERSELRTDMARLRFAEQREGVWIRPDNLSPTRLPEVTERVTAQSYWYFANPWRDETELASALWDIDGWLETALTLHREMVELGESLGGGEQSVVRTGFELSAAVLRHFQRDPLLPRELLPRDWPGSRLRLTYSSFDVAYRRALARWVNA